MTTASVPVASPRAIRLRELPWHPVILAVTIVVTFWLETSVHPLAVFRSLAIAAGTAGLLTVLLAVVMRDRHVAGAIVLGLVLALWSRHLVHLVSATGTRMPEPWQSIAWYALMILAALIAGRLVLRRIRKGWNGPGFTRAANLLAIALLGLTVVAGTTSGALAVAARDLGIGEAPGVRGVETAGQAGSTQRDIYVILLDGYPRADVAEARLGHDNSDFISALSGLGFEVASESHSDYLFTQLSVPSLLNMAYIEQIPALLAVHQAQAPLHPTVRQVLNDNPVFALVRDRGYDVIATASGFEHYALREADTWIDGGQMNEFELQLLALDLRRAHRPGARARACVERAPRSRALLAGASPGDRSERLQQPAFRLLPHPIASSAERFWSRGRATARSHHRRLLRRLGARTRPDRR